MSCRKSTAVASTTGRGLTRLHTGVEFPGSWLHGIQTADGVSTARCVLNGLR